MPYPQPIVTYSGIIGIESCRMLLSRSVEPSQAVIETPVISQVAPAIGDLVFFYNGTTLTFSGCAVDMSYIAMTAAGQTMRITLLDRRWRWAFTEIVGRYNVKTKTDTIKYEKTPQELATLIFQAMGETVYDVSELPNDARPMVDWTNEKGSVALADLLSQLNCEVVPDLSTGGWRIVKIGTGDLLPDDGTAETAESGVTSPITPDAIRAVTASIRYQVMFELEAVGTETDGRSRPIDDLSYKPSGGWELEHPEKFKGVTGTYVKDKSLRSFLAEVAKVRGGSVLVALDYAYWEYVTAPDLSDPAKLVREFPNTVMLRTFSKVYGLAGNRVGYWVAPPELTSAVDKVREPFNLNSLGLAAAEAALLDRAFVSKAKRANAQGMAYWKKFLKKMSVPFWESQGNFLLIDAKTGFGRSGGELFEACLAEGVIFRPVTNYGLPDCLRISIGTQAENVFASRALEKTEKKWRAK